jgi:hypothetical protein
MISGHAPVIIPMRMAQDMDLIHQRALGEQAFEQKMAPVVPLEQIKKGTFMLGRVVMYLKKRAIAGTNGMVVIGTPFRQVILVRSKKPIFRIGLIT